MNSYEIDQTACECEIFFLCIFLRTKAATEHVLAITILFVRLSVRLSVT